MANTAPSFSTGVGYVATPVGTGNDYAYALAVRSDGTMLAGGYFINGTFADMMVLRHTANGTLDTSFGGGDGIASASPGAFSDFGLAMTEQPDGKVIVAGMTRIGSGLTQENFALARFNADGSLDTSFGTGGIVITPVGGGSFTDNLYGVIVQPDGKIVVTGQDGLDIGLLRYNADGTLDSSFGGGDGIADNATSQSDVGYDIALQTDGKILVVGHSGPSATGGLTVSRYNTDGTLDTSFGSTGRTVVPPFYESAALNGGDIVVQPDGKIVAVGTYRHNGPQSTLTSIAVVRFNVDGTLDTSFGGGDGSATFLVNDYSEAHAVRLTADGRILVLGSTTTIIGPAPGGAGTLIDEALLLVRFAADGTLDTSFGGGDGYVMETAGGSFYVVGQDMHVLTDGKIIATGFRQSPTSPFTVDSLLMRFNADGSLDGSFDGVSSLGGGLGGAIAYVEGAAPVVLDGSVAIQDAELSALGNYGGASVSLARIGGASAQDVFSGGGSLAALVEGGAITVSGTAIGTVTQNSAGTLVLTFNSAATQGLLNEALSNIRYANSSDNPPASVEIGWTFNDGNTGAQGTGGAGIGSGSTFVAITGVNDAPVGLPVTLTVSNGIPVVMSAAQFFFSDAESNALDAVRIASTPASGLLTYNGVPVTVGLIVTRADLDAGRLVFTAPASGSGDITFSVQVRDNGGTANGGVDLAVTPSTVTFSINAPPAPSPDSANVLQRAIVTGNVLANDAGAGTLTVGTAAPGDGSFAGVPAGGIMLSGQLGNLTIQQDGSFSYQSTAEGLTAGALYADAFDYTAVANGTPSAAVRLTVNVTGSADGDGGNNIIRANPAGSTLTGMGGDDLLAGGSQNDTLNGGAGNDVLDGGAGNDTLNGGDGGDIVSYLYATSGVRVSLAQTGAQDTLGSGTDTLSGIEILIGSAFADALTGDAFVNILVGADGADVLHGGGGADVLVGGAGADYFVLDALSDSTLATPDIIADFQSGQDKIDFRFIRQSAADSVSIQQVGGYTMVTFDGGGNGTPDARVLLAGAPAITMADILLNNPAALAGGDDGYLLG